MLGFHGRTALVTGGSRGIGRAIAARLAEMGADLVVNYVRHRKDAEETAAMVGKAGRRCVLVKANVAVQADVEQLMEVARLEFGKLDFLISNAASGVFKPALELTERHWNWAMDINARALLTLVQKALPLMPPGSRVIAVSSLGAVRAIENYTTVGASKAALESLARHLAVELGPRGIHVNTISAGAVDTDALKHFPNREQILSAAIQRTPLGRLTTPEDVADIAVFLCGELSKMVQGQVITVDGGYAIRG
ncbi:MAG: enoyl-[acyl-carrier-protein] reductase FabL [Desulfobulbaceae bacterium]|jgi:enoyl-[acyl-carrier protein] reductase III|nr:enoyl-[acyl-carrier-protein] reductase FabL [Desulfobulbaceae bacterium]